MSYKITISFLCFLTLFLVVGPTYGQIQGQMTALQLQNQCTSKYDVDVGMCAGYVAAVADRLLNDSAPQAHVCLSPAISPQTLIANVQAYWTAYPPKAQDFAVDSVEAALRERFRCPS